MQGAEIEDVYKLSPLQQGMLFHNLYHPDSDVYVVQFCLRLAGPLSVGALEQAWERLLAQHPVLRTTFHWEKLQAPSQVVHRRVKLPVEVRDWRERKPEHLERFLAEDRARGFDLTQAPLMRLTVLRTGPEEHLLVWTHHHLLLDGWSVALVVGQVFTLYEALVLGQSREIGRSRPFRDYIAWLRRQDLAEAERFWRRELAGFAAPTPLGSREPLPGRSGFGESTLRIPSETTSALQALSREHQLTLNTLAQAAWALLLSRHAGEEDVLFGVTVSGRPAALPGVESMVGLFINTLPLRVTVEAEAPLLGWLRRLQERQTAVRQYEHSPLFEVQGWSDAPRGTPLFNGLFVFENFPTAAERRAGPTSVEIRDGRMIQPAGYPLTLAVTPGAEMGLRLVYDRARFDEIEVLRFQGHLRTLLENIAIASPGQRLSGIEMLTPAERHQVLVEWNDTAIDFPVVAVHRLFEEWVERTPDAPAVTEDERTLTYRELDAQANSLAWRLYRLGVGPESLVGLLAERSLEMIVGMLAILKAGGAYLPLDPGHPRERLALLLSDAGASLVLAHPSLASRLPEGIARVVSLESFVEGVEADSPGRLPDRAGGHNLVYVIYTSGSTGRPKGVAIQHAGVALLARHAGDGAFATGPDEVWLQLAPMAFDASITEIWTPLANGGRLVLYPAEIPTLDGIAATIRRHGVTSLWLTAGLFHQMVERGLGDLGSVRQLLAGGDILSVAHAEETLRQLPGARLIDGYGPTETTVVISYHPVSAPVGSTVPIGRPIPGSRVYLLGPDFRPVPQGAPGRLFVGSRGLARGYLRRPDLTAERFVPDPWQDAPGGRLYDTGDLARWRPDGVLEFLGRTDAQVKIRGFRVEPGEVETVLREHPDVADAIVLARPDATGQARLVAWLVLDPKSEIQNPKSPFSAWLAERLPDPLIPSAWVTLDALPLTLNGKVDRRALPEPDSGRRETDGPALGPRTPTEEVLEEIWGEVLGHGRIGIEQDFFDLGGHSLAAIQIVSRVRKTFGVELPLRDLFETPTLAGLARRIESLRRAGPAVEIPLEPAPRQGDLPLSFAQQRLWFLDRLAPGQPAYNIPIALRLQGDLEARRLEEALAALVRRHESLRTTFLDQEAGPVQRISLEVPSGLTSRIDLQELPADRQEGEARRLAQEEALAPFDLSHGPLLRCRLLHLGACEHLLLLTLHHIVSDGWSMGVLIRDVLALYGTGSPVLPDLPVQYADYAVWQRRQLQEEVLESRLSFWRERLAEAPARLELPSDRPYPSVRSARGGSAPFELTPELSARIRALGRRQGATLHMTWLAALAALLVRSGCGSDLPVGTTVANRDRRELEDLIGFFVNTLVLRVDAGGDPTVPELLKRARETALAAYAAQDLPFEKLVEELRPERHLSHNALVQVLLAVQNAPSPPIELEGLLVSPVRLGERTARFDLALTVLDTEPGLSGSLGFSADLFDPGTAERMLGHLTRLLDGMTGDAGLRLSELPLMSEAELTQVLGEWSEATESFPPGSCVHDLFERKARRTPEAPAVCFLDEVLTFRELSARSNRLARHLLRRGIARETVVPLLLERPADWMIAALGVLKAGGAFLSLEADEGTAPFVVTRESLLAAVVEEGDAPPLPRVVPSNLCAVIGPRAVLVQHAAVIDLALALRRTVIGLPPARPVGLELLASDPTLWRLAGLLFGEPDSERSDAELPGRPVPGVPVYLLDGDLRPVPAGVVGRIYVAGGNLARGYLGRPDLTASRFLPDPFAAEPGARLFATGEPAVWRTDGLIERKTGGLR